MRRTFNTTGPCLPDEHYMLPPERRLGRVLELIDDRRYFTLHAGRQTGKTTCLLWLERHLNATGQHRALWVDIQIAGDKPDPARAFRTLLGQLDRVLARRFPDLDRPSAADIDDLLRDPDSAVLRYLSRVTLADPRPLIVLFDEADGLVGPAMVSFLTQLRQGYIDRSEAPFPSSVVLVGQRQVRDYVLSADERRAVAWLGTTSPFNVTAEATTLGPFTEPEVAELLAQHTDATGQPFGPAVVQRIWELAQGHPWLTNALADEITRHDPRDRSAPITAGHVDAARDTLILERRSHIDSLVARLREPRVRRILDPMLAGTSLPPEPLDDDVSYVLGLGLVAVRRGFLDIANPIYREVIPRALTYVRQIAIPHDPAWYIRPDGGLDIPALLAAFQTFWRKDGHLAAEGFSYRESGPHLMLMAFLQRIVNGGGRIEREYGLGRGALDLMVYWEDERHAIELKLRRDAETEEEGLSQLARYLDHAGLEEGWLLVFDLRKEIPWTQKLSVREAEHAGKRIHVLGC